MNVVMHNYSHRFNKLLIVLAGYKEVLWDKVFSRLNKYIEEDIDVCVVSSGIYSETLKDICLKYHWTYCSTDINNLCLTQNEVIKAFPAAKYIFKMDEDMFVTKNCFSKMFDTLIDCAKHDVYVPSAVVPLINVNTISYVYLLTRLKKLNDFYAKTGYRPVITNGLHHHKEILEDANVAKYMWSTIKIDRQYFHRGYIPAPGRYSIGLVLFTRETWDDMRHFPVDLEAKEEYKRIGLGEDEKALCVYAAKTCRPIMIDMSTLVGHLGYGPQTKDMIEFFKEHQDLF